MRGPLPVYIDDPVARLRFIRRAMDGLKESKQAVGAATLAAVNNLAPPTILAQASRLNFSTRLFNLLVTNIPGPQLPLYVLGRQLQDLFPVAFLPEDHALAVAIMSYNGGLDYGLLGDYDALARHRRGCRRASRSRWPSCSPPPRRADRRGRRPRDATRRARPSAEHGGPHRSSRRATPRPKRGPAADMRAKRDA